MSGKKIAIMGAGIGSIEIVGLLSQIKPVANRSEPTTDDLREWIEGLFNNVPDTPRHVLLGYDYLVEYRKQHGDDKFYEFVTTMNIQCGDKAHSYIEKFVAWHELKDSQRNKPKLK